MNTLTMSAEQNEFHDLKNKVDEIHRLLLGSEHEKEVGILHRIRKNEDKIDALERAAQARGIQLSAGVLPYLITHYRRDMSSLTAMLDQLDHYSLVTKRPITLPLLRELMLQQQP